MHPIVERVIYSDKRIHLSTKEIARADKSYSGEMRYTIIRRPQPNGMFLVAAVNIENRKVITAEVARRMEDCRKAVAEVNRWMDKALDGGPMSHSSRHRRHKKHRLNNVK